MFTVMGASLTAPRLTYKPCDENKAYAPFYPVQNPYEREPWRQFLAEQTAKLSAQASGGLT